MVHKITAPLILNVGTLLGLVVKYTGLFALRKVPPQYPLYKRLGGPEIRSRHWGTGSHLSIQQIER